MSVRLRVPLSKLWSPKDSIEFRAAPGEAPGDGFFALVHRYRGRLPVEPIEVIHVGGEYYIQDGVRRALAALAAGQVEIEAIVVSTAVAGAPLGRRVRLQDVRFPYDLRGRP